MCRMVFFVNFYFMQGRGTDGFDTGKVYEVLEFIARKFRKILENARKF